VAALGARRCANSQGRAGEVRMNGKQGCRPPATVEGGDGFGCDLVATDVTRVDNRLDEIVLWYPDLRCARFDEEEKIVDAAGDAPDDVTEVAKPIALAKTGGWGTGDASGQALGQGTTGDDEIIAGALG